MLEHIRAALRILTDHSSQASGEPGKILPASYHHLLRQPITAIVASVLTVDQELNAEAKAAFDVLANSVHLNVGAWLLLANTPGVAKWPPVNIPLELAHDAALFDRLRGALADLARGPLTARPEPELRNQIQQVIEFADKYLAEADVVWHYTAVADEKKKNGNEDPLLWDHLNTYHRDLLAARAAILEAGKPLAVALERIGEDSSALLALLNAAEAKNPTAAASLWPPLKVTLQRIAIHSTLPSAGKTDAGGELIGRLLAGRDDAELTRSELAFLSAHLRNYRLPLSKVQQEKKATGESETLARLHKLKTIRDYNRNLQAAPAPTGAAQPDDNNGAKTPPDKTKQSEGNGGASPTPEQPATDPNVKRKEVLEGLQPADRKAYLAYQYAETMAEKRLQDREAYDWLKEHRIDASKGDVGELADYGLPAFDTWGKQLRNARKPLGEQKYTRRGGRRAGRSIVAGKEIEYQRGSDE
jgi:hypothetical protein